MFPHVLFFDNVNRAAVDFCRVSTVLEYAGSTPERRACVVKYVSLAYCLGRDRQGEVPLTPPV